VPPENGGHGYLSPPGRSETTGLSNVFVFNNITPAATVDEGNNWINLSYGPLALFNNAAQSMLATGPNAVIAGAYSIGAASDAVNNGANSGAPARDFFGNPRAAAQGNAADIGAVEFQPGNVNGQAVVSVSPSPLAFGQVAAGTTVTRDLTLANNGGAPFTAISIGVTPASGPFSRVTSGVTGNCGATLTAGAVCTIRIQYVAPAAVGATSTGSVAITGSVTVTGAPVALSGTSVALVRSVSAGPNPLAFGNWASGKTSPPQTVTVLNTGNVAVTGLTYTTAGAGFSPASGAGSGGTCTATLNAGDSCTVNRVFAPTSATAYNRTLTIAGTGITPQVVQLQGTGVALVPSVSVTPSTLLITLPSGEATGTGTVTLTNNAAAGGGQVAVTAVAVAGGGTPFPLLTWFFSQGSDNCSGAILAPQQSCTVSAAFTNVLSPRGPTRSGSITFTDNGATTASQTGQLRGIATP
jgi:hypothetical protein